MKIFGYNISKEKKKGALPTSPIIRQSAAQGALTPYFSDYVARKVDGGFYEFLRESIPIIDAAINRLISVNGIIKIIGDNPALVADLEDFCRYIPVNDMETGIQAFHENAGNEVFEQGFAVSEFIATKDMKDIAGIRVSDSKDIIFRRNQAGSIDTWYREPGSMPTTVYTRPEYLIERILTATYGNTISVYGAKETKLRPDNLIYFSLRNENQDPYGTSLIRSMEFVSKILATIHNATANVWERFGDPSYSLLYKASKGDLGGESAETRRSALAAQFKAVIDAKRAGKSGDFVNAVGANSDIEISIIGGEGKTLTIEKPARHVLEQIVAKTGLPAWMLGLYWSTTERMSQLEVEMVLQDAKVRHKRMEPAFIKLFSTFLKVRGRKWNTITTDPNKPGDWGFYFETPNLRDVMTQAQARFLNAQADQMGSAAGNVTTSTTERASATFEINGMRFPMSAKSLCGCNSPHSPLNVRGEAKGLKEISRTYQWPEMDKLEAEFEAELKFDWKELSGRFHRILGLDEEKGAKDPDKFTFSDAQRAEIMKALESFIGTFDISDPESPVVWYYGQAYSLGLLQAISFIGEEQPILNIIKNREVLDEIYSAGFDLLKDRATKRIIDKILPELDSYVLAGKNPKEVASALSKLFEGGNADWERLARSEMSMAGEKAKLDEWAEWDIKMVEFAPAPDACPICWALAGDYPIATCPVPVKDTHPRCRCSTRPAESETR